MVFDAEQMERFRGDAHRYRASWLASLAAGMVTVDELVTHAASVEGKPLRTISLAMLLSSQDGWTPSKAAETVRRFTDAARQKGRTRNAPPDRPTVSWLLDGRSPNRQLHWQVTLADPDTPWPGFPFAAAPTGGGAV